MVRVAVIAQTAGIASKTEQERLRLSTRERVLRLVRINFQGDRPLAYEKVVLPLARFPGLQDQREITSPILKIAQEFGLALGQAIERMSIVGASATVAAHLGITAGTSLMKIDRVVATRDGEPVEWRVVFSIHVSKR